MHIVIVGAGAAGSAAVKKLRALDKEVRITLISADEAAYSRVMLSKVVGGKKTEDEIALFTAEDMEKQDVKWLRGCPVASVRCQEKRVFLADGRALEYDKLLLATGAQAGKPPVPGLREAENSYVLRDMQDARAIRRAARPGSQWVILGAGLVGMEAAEALCSLGARVTVVEMADRVMPLQMDQRCAGDYQRLFEEAGCAFALSARLARVELEDGRAVAAVLEDGRRLACDGLVTAAGVSPRCGFLEGSGLDWDPRGGIKVDGHLATSQSGVWAAGDVAGLTGTWMPAQEQGETAAVNMLGGDRAYAAPRVQRHMASYYGLSTVSVGEVNGEGQVLTEGETGHYKRVVLREGRVVGVLEQGGAARALRYQKAIEEGRPSAD